MGNKQNQVLFQEAHDQIHELQEMLTTKTAREIKLEQIKKLQKGVNRYIDQEIKQLTDIGGRKEEFKKLCTELNQFRNDLNEFFNLYESGYSSINLRKVHWWGSCLHKFSEDITSIHQNQYKQVI